MVTGHCFRPVINDTSVSAKRKKNQFSSSYGKKQKTSASYKFQGQCRDY